MIADSAIPKKDSKSVPKRAPVACVTELTVKKKN